MINKNTDGNQRERYREIKQLSLKGLNCSN